MTQKPCFQFGDISLYNADCLDVLRGLPAADLVLADMPYGTTQCRWDSPIDLARMWAALPRKDDTAVVLFSQTPFDKVLGHSNLAELKYEWIWEKTSATGHLNAKKMPMKAHENALVFYRKAPFYDPQMTHGHARKTAIADRARNSSECYGSGSGVTSYDSTSRYPRSVQVFPSDKQTSNFHPTQKPLALMEFFVKTYSRPGDLVLDFTMGSGTTGEACAKLGRAFIGVELDADYYEIAKTRVFRASVSAMFA